MAESDEGVPVCGCGVPGKPLASLSLKVSQLLHGYSSSISYFLGLCENLGSSILGLCHPPYVRRGRWGIRVRGWLESRVQSLTPVPTFTGTWGIVYSWKQRLRISGLISFVIWGKFLVLPLAISSASFSRFSPSGTPIARMLDLLIASHVFAVLCSVFHSVFSWGSFHSPVFKFTAYVFSGCVQFSVNPIHELGSSDVIFFHYTMFI